METVAAVVQSTHGSFSSKKKCLGKCYILIFFFFTKKVHKALFLEYSKSKQKVGVFCPDRTG